MKFIDTVSQITRKVSNLITHFVYSHTPFFKIQANKLQKSKLKKKKAKRIRNFKSFSEDSSSQSISSSSKIRKFSDKLQICPKKHPRFKRENSGYESSISSQQNQSQRLTKESPPVRQVRFEAEPQFKDENGLQISIIEQQQNIRQQVNNLVQSDPQILKFVFGDDFPSTRAPSEEKKDSYQNRIFVRKEWWRQVIEKYEQESELNQRISQIREFSQSQINQGSSQLNSSAKRLKTRRIKHRRPKNIRKATIKVVNILDLVESEDNPRLFQIPLAISQ